MTSHITVSASQTSSTTTGFATPSSSDSASSGGFGAILDAIGSFGKSIVDGGSQTAAAATPHPGFVHLDSTGATTASDAANADALAKALQNAAANASVSAPLAATAATDATAGATDTTSGTPPKLLQELVDSLAELQKAQQDGTPVDQDLLKRVKKAVDAISNFLATQQPIQGVATDPTTSPDASSSTTAPAGTPTTTSATAASAAADAAKATLTALNTKLEALSSNLAQSAPDVSAKLDQLAKALDPAKLSSDTISQFGLDASDSSADPKLTAAINGLVSGKAEAATALPQPALATPTLKLPEGTALSDNHSSGTLSTDTPKSAQTTSATAPTTPTATADQNASGDASTDSSKKDTQSASLSVTASEAADKAKDAAAIPAASTNATTPQATPVAATQAQTAQAAYVPATAAAVALSQVPVEIVRHIQQGDSHFQIKLDPADLGRIDVKLAFDSSGTVNARVTAERPETLALLQRDSGSLNQALTQAGLDSSKTNLQFSLSQNPFAGQNSSGGGGSNSSQPQVADDDASADTIAPASVAVLYRGTASSSGLNIVV